jgi:hypothetical protein
MQDPSTRVQFLDLDLISNTLIIHWQYHPDGLQCSDIRNTYKKTLEPHLPFDNVKVAVSRPKNLWDILMKTALTLPHNINTEQLIEAIKPR